MSLRVALRRGLVQGVLLFAPGAAIFTVAASQPIPITYVAPEHGAAAVAEPSRADRMVASGRCWVGEAPADVTAPGHVWVDGQYRGAAAVGKALEQIFEGVDHGMQVQAFCR